MPKLHEIPRGSRIYCKCEDGSTYITFHNLDGMYSFCTTEKENITHLSVLTELQEREDGSFNLIGASNN